MFAARGRMSKMVGDAAEEERPASHATVFETCCQLLVFRPPANHVLVEAVDTLEVDAPRGQVAALRSDERIRHLTELIAEWRSMQGIEAPQSSDASRPWREITGTALQQFRGAPCVEQDARSLHPVTRSRKATMLRDELRMHHHVAIKDH